MLSRYATEAWRAGTALQPGTFSRALLNFSNLGADVAWQGLKGAFGGVKGKVTKPFEHD